ncbi:MAG: hypothetical protein FWC15_08745 [Fibromonadales bacterium]|nr:hypothetical protein [Fibromonadales bacterium]
MIENLIGGRPATSRDIDQLLAAVNTESLYIKSEEYRRLIKMGKTQFSYLKELGRFDAGTHPATLGSSHIRIHKHFSLSSQRIELLEEEETNKPLTIASMK